MTHPRVTLAAIALTLMAATGAAAQDTGFGAGTPESRYFRIDSTVTAGRRGPQLEGYVYNVYDAHALRVRLNVEAIDAAGRLIERRAAHLPPDVPPPGPPVLPPPPPPGPPAAPRTLPNLDWAPPPAGGGAEE